MIVDVDRDGKAFGGGGFEPGERGLLVGDNKGDLRLRWRGEGGGGGEEQSGQEAEEGEGEMRDGHEEEEEEGRLKNGWGR